MPRSRGAWQAVETTGLHKTSKSNRASALSINGRGYRCPIVVNSGSVETWAAIFDWDGVIIDSSRQHEASWELLAQAENLRLPQNHFQLSFGMKNQNIIPEILEWTTDPHEIQRLSDRKEAFYRDVLRTTGMKPLPGVLPWLRQWKSADVPCAVGTSTDLLNVETAMSLAGLDDFFSAVASSEDVTRGKPDPEVFLKAAAKVGVVPERCVVFEDAPSGVEAGLAAGMKVVAVTTTRPAERLGGAHRVVGRLDELELGQLAAWFV